MTGTNGESPDEEDEAKGSPQGGYYKIRSCVQWRMQPSQSAACRDNERVRDAGAMRPGQGFDSNVELTLKHGG